MQAVILAGGKGTRLSEYTKTIPKPMVKVAGKPIIWHLLHLLYNNGICDFIICGGYKGDLIEKYLLSIKNKKWRISYIFTGINTNTAKRIGLIESLIKEEIFLMTYGDGLSDINIKKLVNFHKKKNKLATVTAVPQPPRFGLLNIKNNIVSNFSEKKKNYNQLINGGFFILNKKIFKKLNLKKNVMWEQDPMKQLTKTKQLAAYIYKGFWHPMDTLRDKKYLDKVYKNKKIKSWRQW